MSNGAWLFWAVFWLAFLLVTDAPGWACALGGASVTIWIVNYGEEKGWRT